MDDIDGINGRRCPKVGSLMRNAKNDRTRIASGVLQMQPLATDASRQA